MASVAVHGHWQLTWSKVVPAKPLQKSKPCFMANRGLCTCCSINWLIPSLTTSMHKSKAARRPYRFSIPGAACWHRICSGNSHCVTWKKLLPVYTVPTTAKQSPWCCSARAVIHTSKQLQIPVAMALVWTGQSPLPRREPGSEIVWPCKATLTPPSC